ncbi:MAG: 2-oxoglutarate dehydrogenase complex dihydrolipoyllysine-residue succinyltransferase, partial [Sinobacterium sp.]|nr:2-oxoglutarate dehydrogenase complex dihydrolipoyllysine-residue succinyltransferase [Sinobacterium sp.]
MSIDIKAPQFPESVADGTIATWYKQPGEAVARDELIVDIETDKVVLEVVAPQDGSLSSIIKGEGDTVLSEELIATFVAGAVAESAPAAAASNEPAVSTVQEPILSPAARKLADEKNIDPATIVGTGKGGRISKEDVENATSAPKPTPQPAPVAEVSAVAGDRVERRVPMTRMRKRIAERLLGATQETAMLTTFNEVNMEPIMTLRKKYKDQFEKSHNGTKLGFMSFFVRAATEALKRHPAVNASIDGDDIVYHGFQDIGVAVSTEKGLVVPVLRDSDHMSLADIESKIREYGLKARDGKLGIDEMTGGTFTITNGGVFGSMMSTPILNPPQAAILGMHAINEKPMAVNGEVVIQPMMYLALSYDHR